jgi:hypothetical protein
MSTEIMNMALDLLEEEPILSQSDNRAAVRWMNRNYGQTRNELLESHPWKFALRRAVLNAEAEQPSFGPLYSYPLPVDCVSVLPPNYGGHTNSGSMSFHREGNAVLANTSGPLLVRYISNDEESFSALFKRALATSLAAKAASLITGKQTYAQLLTNMAANVTLQAQMRDSLQATPDHVEEEDWTRARNGDFGWGTVRFYPWGWGRA